MSATFTFEELRHIYTTDKGEIVPSVSQVLALAGISDVSGIPAHILDRASAIGTAVHQACEYLDHNDLDLDSLDPLIVGYVVGYQKFKEDTGFIPELIEHRMITKQGGIAYGMCVDRTGTIKNSKVLLDIKTSAKPQSSWAIQTAAYECALDGVRERLVVQVTKDGKYSKILFTSNADYVVWQSALTVADWKLRNGAKLK